MALTALEEVLLNLLKDLMKINSDLIRLYTEFRNHTDAAIVLNATEILKEQIGKAIRIQLDPLKSGDIKRILGKPASPKGLAVQIDVVSALGILDNATYEIAIKILVLRNIFGHDKRLLSLNQEPALSAFCALHTNPKFTGRYAGVFLEYVGIVDAHLNSYLASYQLKKVQTKVFRLES